MNKEYKAHLDSISNELLHIRSQNKQMLQRLAELEIKKIDHREIVNIKEACEITSHTVRTVRTYVSKGLIKAHKRGKPLQFKVSDLKMYLKEK